VARNTKKPEPKPTTPQGEADLRQLLAQRERDVAALTEHSLRILDELAEARRQAGDPASLQHRVERLQEALADARQRVRSGARAILGTVDATVQGTHGTDVVLWDPAVDLRQELAQRSASLEGCSITLLTGQRHRSEQFREALKPGWSVLASSCLRPAHFWNQAMASTHGDVVVFVGAQSAITADGARALAAAARASGVAIACPRLLIGESTTLGRCEQGVLDMQPMPMSQDAVSGTVPFASPEAFALTRSAFEAVGPFDQDLATELALAEWTMRAAHRSLVVVGVVEAEARAAVGAAPSSDALEADRLVVLARHRPHQLMTAALASESLWTMDGDALAATLRAAIQRLPRAQEMPAAVDILVQQTQTVANWKRIAPAVRNRIVALAKDLGFSAEDTSSDQNLPSLLERVGAAVGAMRQRATAADVAEQAAQKALREADAARAQQRNVEAHLKDEMLARSNTIDALRNELLERERAIASLREELGRRQGESQRAIDYLAQQQQQILDLQEQRTANVRELERRRGVEERMLAAEEELAELRSELALERAASALQNETHAGEQRKLVAALARQSEKLRQAQQDGDAARSSAADAIADCQRMAGKAEELVALRERYEAVQAQRFEANAAYQAAVRERDAARAEAASAIAACESQRADADRERQRANDAIEHAEQARLRAEQAASDAEADARLRSEAVKRAERAEARAEAAEQSANAAAARALQLEARLRTAEAQVAELEGSVEAERASRQQAETLSRSRAEQQDLAIRELESKLSDAVADCERLLDDVEERGARAAQFDRKQRDLTRLVDTVRKELLGTREEAIQLRAQCAKHATRADEALRVLAEREEWVCLLLDEVKKRRVVPRDLLEHERQFLDAHGKTSKP
jgi:hypothetical protein